MSFSYLSNMGFQLCLTTVYPCKQTNNIGPTYCKSRNYWKSLQPAAIHRRICLEQNVQVGCHLFHFDSNLTIYCSSLPTSVRYHLPNHFHNPKSWLHLPLSLVRVDLNSAKRQVLLPMLNLLKHSCNTDTSLSTATLPMQPREIWPRSTFENGL